MEQAEQQPAQRSVAPFAVAAAALWVCGAALLLAAAPAEAQRAVLFGALAAGLGGGIALAALAVAMRRGTSGLVAGFGAGFLARVALVAAGLVASGAQGRAALLYAASFFALYAMSQAVEIAFVWMSSRGRATSAKA